MSSVLFTIGVALSIIVVAVLVWSLVMFVLSVLMPWDLDFPHYIKALRVVTLGKKYCITDIIQKWDDTRSFLLGNIVKCVPRKGENIFIDLGTSFMFEAHISHITTEKVFYRRVLAVYKTKRGVFIIERFPRKISPVVSLLTVRTVKTEEDMVEEALTW